MQIKMLADQTGSENGILVKSFYKDELYEVVDSLGNAFVSMKVAEQISKDAEPTVKESLQVEEKALDAAPENKAIKQSDIKNKSKSKGK